jgi:hypothetical protein
MISIDKDFPGNPMNPIPPPKHRVAAVEDPDGGSRTSNVSAPMVLRTLARFILQGMRKPLDPWIDPDQQPIQRIVGKRVSPPPGAVPEAAVRAAMVANSQYRTRVPKGIFFYRTHDEMVRDRERWTVDAIVARHRERA